MVKGFVQLMRGSEFKFLFYYNCIISVGLTPATSAISTWVRPTHNLLYLIIYSVALGTPTQDSFVSRILAWSACPRICVGF